MKFVTKLVCKNIFYTRLRLQSPDDSQCQVLLWSNWFKKFLSLLFIGHLTLTLADLSDSKNSLSPNGSSSRISARFSLLGIFTSTSGTVRLSDKSRWFEHSYFRFFWKWFGTMIEWSDLLSSWLTDSGLLETSVASDENLGDFGLCNPKSNRSDYRFWIVTPISNLFLISWSFSLARDLRFLMATWSRWVGFWVWSAVFWKSLKSPFLARTLRFSGSNESGPILSESKLGLVY